MPYISQEDELQVYFSL